MIGLILSAFFAGSAFAAPIDADLSKVVDLFYDLRFEESLLAAERLEREHPGHPAGPFMRGLAAYQRYLLEDPVRRETLAEFDRQMTRCIEAAEAYRKRDPIVHHQYLGGCHGFRARVFGMERRFVRAIRSARLAVRHLKKAEALAPELADVELGLGMYDYFMDRMPTVAKPFAWMMMGLWGDRVEGLRRMRLAAGHGMHAKMEARSALSAIYASDYEKNWAAADALLKDLTRRYPHNPLFRLRRAYVAERLGRWDAAVEIADPEGRWLDGLAEPYREKARALARYRAAESLLLSGRKAAAQKLLAALAAGPLPRALPPWVRRRLKELASDAPTTELKPVTWPLSALPLKG